MVKTDVFLTHDWGKDELGRDNHSRVAAVNDGLKAIHGSIAIAWKETS